MIPTKRKLSLIRGEELPPPRPQIRLAPGDYIGRLTSFHASGRAVDIAPLAAPIGDVLVNGRESYSASMTNVRLYGMSMGAQVPSSICSLCNSDARCQLCERDD